MPVESLTLDAAIERLYDSFAAWPRSEQLDFCSHCVLPDEAAALARTPLRDLGSELLKLFLFNALSWTWGEPDDLWHYLPRILELLADGELGDYELDMLFTAAGGVWRDWPQDQQDALTGYLTALWRAVLSGDQRTAGLSVPGLLQAAGCLRVQADSYLHAWQAGGELTALQLARFIPRLRRSTGLATTWPPGVIEWVTGPAAKQVLTSALATASTPEVAADLSTALRVLEHDQPA
jgi:hypothetical protein